MLVMIYYYHIFIAICDICGKEFRTFANFKDEGIKIASNNGWSINQQYNTARCPEHKYKSRFKYIINKFK